jgi:hypothetical protein
MTIKVSEQEYKQREEICSICITLMKRENPNIKGCVWRCLGNDYCDNMVKKAKEYGFNYEWLESEATE